MELILLLVCSLSVLSCVQLSHCAASGTGQESPDALQVVKDESHALSDNELGSIVRELGEQLQDAMGSEMARLVRELEEKKKLNRQLRELQQARATNSSPPQSGVGGELSDEELQKLIEANRAAGRDIQARIEMAGDNKGSLPQSSLGSKASSFLTSASHRLGAAGSYIGNKLRTISSSVASKIPARMKRFFKWPTFLQFKIRHHKVYKSAREELYRQMVFLRTHVKVGMQHLRYLLRRDRHLLGPNQYADMTHDEVYEALNNEQAGEEAKELSASPEDHATLVANMKKLAQSKQNIFGREIVTRDKKRSEKKVRRRRKRAAADEDDDHFEDTNDELYDTEDEEDDDLQSLGTDFGSASDSDDEDADNEEDYKLVEEFANADLSNLDDIDSNLDEALETPQEASKFEPIDLRDTGCIVRPENQNRCGICYAQATTAAATYYQCMGPNGGKIERYHPRFTSDCGRYTAAEGKPAWIKGCQGGRMSEAIKFQRTMGLPRFGDYNIAQVSARVMDVDRCAYPRPEGPLAEHNWPIKLKPVEHYQKSRFTVLKLEEVDLHLRTVGPVLVNIRTWDNFEHYEAGIYDQFEEAEKPGLHSMMIVGHDRDAQGRDYYIFWNSHGIAWGERGFMRMSAESLAHFVLILVGLPPDSLE